jgi:RNA polymerase sigma-54 factor
MKLRQVIAQRPTITPQLVLANRLLQLSSTELEQAILQELSENPALELVEEQRCPKCGTALRDGDCPFCSKARKELAHREYDLEGAPSEYGDDRDDGTSQLSSQTTLAEHLLTQARLSLAPQDMPIAAHLVESLDDHGLLGCELDQVAGQLGVERTRVERVVSALQELEPVGIAAKDTRECLLIQLEHLRDQGVEQPLARALIDEHWEALGRQSLSKVAKAAGTTVDEVQAALEFIKDNLNPFPAHVHWETSQESPAQKEPVYLQPDVVIQDGGETSAYKVELPRARSYKLRINPSFLEVMQTSKAGKVAFTQQDVEEWKAFYARARLFIKGIEQRWQTLRDIVRHLVDYQRDFLLHGDGHLKPLTRAQLAEIMDVHESTISRAVADKNVQLPGGRIVPLARFFDRSVPAKQAIKELIDRESKPLSDQELVGRLAQQGYHIARRTVAKYREALDIPPSSVRRRNKQVSQKFVAGDRSPADH